MSGSIRWGTQDFGFRMSDANWDVVLSVRHRNGTISDIPSTINLIGVWTRLS